MRTGTAPHPRDARRLLSQSHASQLVSCTNQQRPSWILNYLSIGSDHRHQMASCRIGIACFPPRALWERAWLLNSLIAITICRWLVDPRFRRTSLYRPATNRRTLEVCSEITNRRKAPLLQFLQIPGKIRGTRSWSGPSPKYHLTPCTRPTDRLNLSLAPTVAKFACWASYTLLFHCAWPLRPFTSTDLWNCQPHSHNHIRKYLESWISYIFIFDATLQRVIRKVDFELTIWQWPGHGHLKSNRLVPRLCPTIPLNFLKGIWRSNIVILLINQSIITF